MADVMVVLVSLLFFVQVLLIGGFICFGAVRSSTGRSEAWRGEAYQPMRLLIERGQRAAAPGASSNLRTAA